MKGEVIIAFIVSLTVSVNAVNIGGYCGMNAECSGSVTNSYCMMEYTTCYTGTCMCNSGYGASGTTSCKMVVSWDATCDTSTQMCDTAQFTACTGTPAKCTCTTGLTYNTMLKKCIATGLVALGVACSSVANCYTTGSAVSSMECVGTATVCACKANYISENYMCRLPRLGEACNTTPGCGTLGLSEAITETCQSSVCACPSATSTQVTVYTSASATYKLCQATYSGTKKRDIQVCTANNMCNSHICAACPGRTSTKICLRIHSGAPGVTINVLSLASILAVALFI